jgi:hypothetical protein
MIGMQKPCQTGLRRFGFDGISRRMGKKTTKELGEVARIRVQKEMAKPRRSKSVRDAETNQTAMRIVPTHQGLHTRTLS